MKKKDGGGEAKRPHRWTQAEDAFIKKNSHRLTDKQIAAAMSRLLGEAITAEMVRHRRRGGEDAR